MSERWEFSLPSQICMPYCRVAHTSVRAAAAVFRNVMIRLTRVLNNTACSHAMDSRQLARIKHGTSYLYANC